MLQDFTPNEICCMRGGNLQLSQIRDINQEGKITDLLLSCSNLEPIIIEAFINKAYFQIRLILLLYIAYKYK